MNWATVGEYVKKGAPLLGTILGGPAGAAAGGAVSLICSALGIGGDDATPEQVMGILQGNPEAMVKIKELEYRHRERLEELTLDRAKLAVEEAGIYLKDTQSARERETKIVQATGKTDYSLHVLAWTVIIGFFLLVGFMMRWTLPDANVGPVNQLMGSLSTGFGVVLSYFFGTSMSSRRKTEMMGSRMSEAERKPGDPVPM